MDFIIIILISFAFGITQKMADAANEHKVNLFKNYNIAWGVLFGISGAFIAVYDVFLTLYFIVLIIYWLIKNKLDYLNHQISASIILLGIIFYREDELRDMLEEALFLLLIFFIFDFVTRRFRGKNIVLFDFFDKYKFRFLIISLLVSIYGNDWLVFLSITTTILAILLTTKVLLKYFGYKK